MPVPNSPPFAPHLDYVTNGVSYALDLFQLAASASDPDGDSLTISGFGTPAHGTIDVIEGQTYYYANPLYIGIDQFTYTVSDGHGGSTDGTISIETGQTVVAMDTRYVWVGDSAKGLTLDNTGRFDFLQVKATGFDDHILGGAANETLNGGAGNDIISGGAGKDVLIGGSGYDQVWGGSDADNFVFYRADIADSYANNGHYDEIMDFEGAGDGYHPGTGDILTLNGFSAAATLTLDAGKTAASLDASAHYYIILDGSYSAEIVIHYAGNAILKAGDFGFHP